MPMYRLYCLRKGRITKGDWLEAEDDSQAIATAREQNPDADCELWQKERLIARIPVGGTPIIVDG